MRTTPYTVHPSTHCKVTFTPGSDTYGTLPYWTVEFWWGRQEADPVRIEVYEVRDTGWMVQNPEDYPDGFAKLAVKSVEIAEQKADQQDEAAAKLADTQVIPTPELRQQVEQSIAAALVVGLLIGSQIIV